MRYAPELKEPAFASRAYIAGADAQSSAREKLQLSPASYVTTLRGSAIMGIA
jgi:hypothetical protein